MYLVLTRTNDGKSILVNAEEIKMIEPDFTVPDQTNVVMESGLVRTVVETIAQIEPLIESLTPAPLLAPAATVSKAAVQAAKK